MPQAMHPRPRTFQRLATHQPLVEGQVQRLGNAHLQHVMFIDIFIASWAIGVHWLKFSKSSGIFASWRPPAGSFEENGTMSELQIWKVVQHKDPNA